ncbi:hypothetical protein Patl1_10228 [Pistacia atlantica]|uniref:Uncharacterized protein n=2 Tax=Pistacia atlantica TaxID=434234 RepID=A0ACC1A6V1_9ROSI|nr:hypothetical protein Patl1_10229 [Pistacia atlantica]KAJ0081961.1 hypothetical protein Patl1_10228 [Pistacia atlantica]
MSADNLAANFSRELADYIIYIIDVSGGDKIPRKGGPGITQADLLVINKTDLAPAVGADLAVMERDALKMRDGGPFVFAQLQPAIGNFKQFCLWMIYVNISYTGQACAWCGGNSEPHFTGLGSSNWEEAALMFPL